ncbi:hypothetical protein BFP72_14260 [Reichenbachiella sp. 5M10]|uniref:hypothetical protein n=1 Tax=Reichenbachiella sp. 5M10 TaxID=1889772 RepID=UPI000C14B6BC|nr:hypothetical protein [Reichenbachiella sp. 5M10]PIB36477.1 hypothetical protein BFP72_14260 [Reichenbachiella sp. 5M10]
MLRYSMFLNDTTPKMAMESRRTKYGVNKKSSLFRKNYDMKTAPKENVLGNPKRDPLYAADEGDFLASDFVDVDSIGVDSVSAAPLFATADDPKEVRYKYRYNPKNAYNQEQEYYNKYYGELFIDKRPTQSEMVDRQLEHLDAPPSDSTTTESRKGWFGRKKEEVSEEEAEVDQETLDQVKEEDPSDGFEPEEAVDEAPVDAGD